MAVAVEVVEVVDVFSASCLADTDDAPANAVSNIARHERLWRCMIDDVGSAARSWRRYGCWKRLLVRRGGERSSASNEALVDNLDGDNS